MGGWGGSSSRESLPRRRWGWQVGLIILSRNGTGGDGAMVAKPPDVDREFVIFFKIFDEFASWCGEARIGGGEPKPERGFRV